MLTQSIWAGAWTELGKNINSYQVYQDIASLKVVGFFTRGDWAIKIIFQHIFKSMNNLIRLSVNMPQEHSIYIFLFNQYLPIREGFNTKKH